MGPWNRNCGIGRRCVEAPFRFAGVVRARTLKPEVRWAGEPPTVMAIVMGGGSFMLRTNDVLYNSGLFVRCVGAPRPEPQEIHETLRDWV